MIAASFRARLERLPFRLKLAVAILFASIVALGAASIVFLFLQERTAAVELSRVQALTAKAIGGVIAEPVVRGDATAVLRAVKAIENLPELRRLAIIDPRGRERVAIDRPGRTAAGSRTVRVPILDAGRAYGHVELVLDNPDMPSAKEQYLAIVGAISMVVVLLSILLAGAVSNLLFRPLRAMTLAMEQIRRSRDYTARVEQLGDSETRRVIDSLNALLDEVERRDNELASVAVELAEARDAAQKASEAKSVFLANMSHELRTPLNAIIGYADVLKQDLIGIDQPQLANDAQWIDGSARHLLVMINELLDMAKIESGRMELDLHEVDVREIADGLRAILEPLATQHGNRLRVEVGGDVGAATLDSGKLRQCLVNIGGNACKFTSDGIVDIAVRNIAIAKRDWIEFCIADTGIGMTQDQIDRLFQPFVQGDTSTTRRFGGTGLGLAITASLVKLMGARLSVDSTPGVGTTFRLRVPRSLSFSAPAVPEAMQSINRQPSADIIVA
jgi:signal transduction histidine kinase